MRRLLSASLLAITSALPAFANSDNTALEVTLSEDLKGNFFTDCVAENLEKQFPDIAVTATTKPLRDGSQGFTIQAPFEDAKWLPDGVYINGAIDGGMVSRIGLSTRNHGEADSQNLYHPKTHGHQFFKSYAPHSLSSFSDTFRFAVSAISSCPTTELEDRNKEKSYVVSKVSYNP